MVNNMNTSIGTEMEDSNYFISSPKTSKVHHYTACSSVTSSAMTSMNLKSSKTKNMKSYIIDQLRNMFKRQNINVPLLENKSTPLLEEKDSIQIKISPNDVKTQPTKVNHKITRPIQSLLTLGRVKKVDVEFYVILFGLLIMMSIAAISIFITRSLIDYNVDGKMFTLSLERFKIISEVFKEQRSIKSELLKMQTDIKSMKSNEQLITKSEMLQDGIPLNTSHEASYLRVIYGNSCFCLYVEQLSWYNARDFCLSRGYGAHMAEIHHPNENNFLLPILQASLTSGDIWLGASDLGQEGTWHWNYTGTQVQQFEPTQWVPGKQSRLGQDGQSERCIKIYNWNVTTFPGKWSDDVCEDVKPYLCRSSYNNKKWFC